MKIIINYDYINAIKNVNEKYTPFKVIRNNKVKWVKVNLPIYTAANMLITNFDLKRTAALLGLQFFTLTGCFFVLHSATTPDVYSVKSELALRDLVRKLKDVNVDTSFELLKQSELYDKKYEIKLNEKKLPELIQSKYILVPTYDYLGSVKETSIVQEHIMGSKDYVLSLGSPQKVLKPALSNI